MKMSKGILYYFVFWILYLPLNIVLTIILNQGIEEFFVSLGLGALIQFVFLSLRLIVMKLKEPKDTDVEQEISESNLDAIEKTIGDVKNEETQLA